MRRALAAISQIREERMHDSLAHDQTESRRVGASRRLREGLDVAAGPAACRFRGPQLRVNQPWLVSYRGRALQREVSGMYIGIGLGTLIVIIIILVLVL